MSLADWTVVIYWLLGIAAVLFVGVVWATTVGRLNAPGDDDPETIIARPVMNPDDNDWGRL
jgi:hypothetical protein